MVLLISILSKVLGYLLIGYATAGFMAGIYKWTDRLALSMTWLIWPFVWFGVVLYYFIWALIYTLDLMGKLVPIAKSQCPGCKMMYSDFCKNCRHDDPDKMG